jgi:glycogen operon protein
MMSLGTPMILMGDEVRRTQRGNNNAYCHDNDLSWFDWTLVDKHADVRRFVSLLCGRRTLRSVKHECEQVSLTAMLRAATKAWHGVKLDHPDWSDGSLSVALGGELLQDGILFHFMLNAYWEPLAFELPELKTGESWRRWIDTALDSPDDIAPWDQSPTVPGKMYHVADRSVVMLYTVTNRSNPLTSQC